MRRNERRESYGHIERFAGYAERAEALNAAHWCSAFELGAGSRHASHAGVRCGRCQHRQRCDGGGAGTKSTQAFSVDPSSPHVTAKVEYQGDDRSQADVTFTLDQSEYTPKSYLFLVDASEAGDGDAREVLSTALNSYTGSMARDLFADAPGSTARIISYGSEVEESETFTSYEEVLAASSIKVQPGKANESKALDATKNAVEQARKDRPGQPVVVMWVPGSAFGQQESDFSQSLAALSSCMEAGDALMTFQVAHTPSDLLSQYATAYTPTDGEQQKAAWANASPHVLSVEMGEAADDAAHDHFNDVQLHVAISTAAQEFVTGIESVAVGWKDCSATEMLSSDYEPVSAAIDGDGKGFTFTTDCVRNAWVTVRVNLDPSNEGEYEAFAAGSLGAKEDAESDIVGFCRGMFDEQVVEPSSVATPAVRLSRMARTISYDLAGAQGETPDSLSAIPGSPVAIADASGIFKEGMAFGGWTATLADGSIQRYSAGEVASMPSEDIVLRPAWGQAKVELEVADVEPATNGNHLMESAYNELGYSVLDFSNVMVEGQKVGHSVKTVTFADAEVGYTASPNGEDARRVDLIGVENAVYARWVGEAASDKVVAYLTKRSGGDGYDMTVAGPGGVCAPVDARFLFSNPTQSSITEPSTWQDNLEVVDFNGAFTLNPAGGSDLSYWFRACANLKEIKGLESLDMSRARYLIGMFVDCDALTSLDLSSWDVRNVTMMAQMFWGCDALTSVDVSWGDATQNVTNVAYFFNKATKLQHAVGVEGWWLPNCTDITQVFFATNSLEGSIDLSHWFAGDTPAVVTTANHLFDSSGVSAITARNWNVPQLTELGYAFAYQSRYDYEGEGYSLTKLDLADWTTETSLDLNGFAAGQELLTSVDMANWDTGYTDIWWYLAFQGCKSLQTLNMPGWILNNKFYFGEPGTTGHVSPWLAMWGVTGDINDFGTTVTINCDNWTFAPDAPDVGKDYPGLWSESRYPITFPFSNDYDCDTPRKIILSANNWDLGGSEQDLGSLFSNSGTTMSDFSGWTGLSGVTSLYNMLWYPSGTLETFSLVNADMPNLTKATGLFGPATALKSADFSGWSGMDATVLSDLFSGMDQSVAQNLSLTVSNDQIGSAIKQALESAVTSQVIAEQGVAPLALDQTDSASNDAVTAIDRSQTEAGALDLEARAAVEDSEVMLPTDVVSVQDADGASADASANSSSMVVHPDPTAPGAVVGLRATIGYAGDTGARSGDVELSVPLPEGMVQNPENTTVVVGDWRYASADESGDPVDTGFIGGDFVEDARVETDSQTGLPTLRATVRGMYAGTEVEVGFSVQLEDVAMQGGYKLWDVTAYEAAAPGASAVSNTLRFWWNEGGTPPSGSYRVEYRYEGEVPPDASVPPAQVANVVDVVDLPSPTTTYAWYAFDGWTGDGEDVVIEGDSFTMPGRDVILTGTWSIDEEAAPRVGVRHGYVPGCAANHVPDAAPALPEDAQVVVGRTGTISGLAPGTRVEGHTFGGWEPVLVVDGQEIRGQNRDGVWEFSHGGSTYAVDVSSGLLDTAQFVDLARDGSSVSVAFEGSWSPDTGSISFDANGGVGAMDALEGVEVCSTEALPSNEFSREGYAFQGWATAPDGEVVFSADAARGEVVVAEGSTVTLYAVWKAVSYPVDLSGLDHVVSSNTAVEIAHGQPYDTVLSPVDGYRIGSVKVTMGGVDVTNEVYNAETGAVSIAAVTGDIRVEASAYAAPAPGPGPDPAPEPEPEPEPGPTPGTEAGEGQPSEAQELVRTGDASPIVPLALGGAALAALVVLALALRRQGGRK